MAREMFAHRLRKYLGAYLAVLGRVDAVVFTAGIGEHDWWTRERVCADLEPLGIVIDVSANRTTGQGPRSVAAAHSPIDVLVVPTDEEYAIAAQSWACAPIRAIRSIPARPCPKLCGARQDGRAGTGTTMTAPPGGFPTRARCGSRSSTITSWCATG